MRVVHKAVNFVLGLLGMMLAVLLGWMGFAAMDPARLIAGIVIFALSTVLTVLMFVDLIFSEDK